MHIVIDENMAVTPALEALATTLVALPGRAITHDHLSDADALLVRSVTDVGAELLDGTPVKFVGTGTAGTEHVDRHYLEHAGIHFSAAPGCNANAVAEFVLAQIARSGRMADVLAGAAVGIVGYGHVGRRLSQTLKGLGATVVVYDPLVDVPEPLAASALADVLACPVVSLHASLTGAGKHPSEHMIDGAAATMIASNALFINAGRGGLVTSDALYDLAARGVHLALDVWPDEPQIHPQLLDAVGCATPHVAGYSERAKANATDHLVGALLKTGLLETESRSNDVDGPTLGDNSDNASKAAAKPLAPSHATQHSAPVAAWLSTLLPRFVDLEADDHALRQAMGDDESINRRAFDALRRDYNLRAEIRGSTVDPGELPEAVLQPVARALGVTWQ